MARLYCSPRSISVCSLSRCACMAARGSSIYRLMATRAAIRKTSSSAKPRSFPRSWLRRATGVLRDLHRLFAFCLDVFDHYRLGIDAHHPVALLHGHALGGQDDIFSIQEKRRLLAIDPLGGETIVL